MADTDFDKGSDIVALVNELVREPHERPWLEFKENLFDPQDVGEYIAALSNSAVLAQRPRAYRFGAYATATMPWWAPPSTLTVLKWETRMS